MAQKDDISDALNRGLTISSIWELLRDEGLFDGTYKTFCKYVALYITDKKSTTVKQENEQAKTPSEQPKPQQQIQLPTPQQPKKRFDWSTDYDPKRLIGD